MTLRRLAFFAPLPFIIAIGATLAGWSPSWEKRPQIPMAGLYGQGIGRCVALYEDDTLVGITINRTEDMRKADANRAAYAISTYNAATLAAQNAGRPDLASILVNLRVTDGPDPMQEARTADCWCESTIWSGDPRKGGTVVGCGGGCSSCTHCVVRSPEIQ